MTSLLTTGNSAKLYCLNLIEKIINHKSTPLTLIDLGCGTAANFPKLLEKYPHLRYIGVEPSASDCEIAQKSLSSFNATIINKSAYDLELEPADIIISFSALEHVYRRLDYIKTVKKNMRADGLFLINYDAGHFVDAAPAPIWAIGTDRWKNLFGDFIARMGNEQYFQKLVEEAEFQMLLEMAGLKSLDGKYFNTDLKNIYKLIPSYNVEDFMQHWLDFELFLNKLQINYDDSMSKHFRSRNFVVTHRGTPLDAFKWLFNHE